MVRAQYYFQPSPGGLLAWDVRRLIVLSKDLPVLRVPLTQIDEIDTCRWHDADEKPTCRNLVEHMRLVQDCDLSYPIILNASGQVMDGMHRVCKSLLLGLDDILAVQFAQTPTPDYVGHQPDDLLYDD